MDFNLLNLGMPSSADASVQTLSQIIGPVINSIIGDNPGVAAPLGIFAGMIKTFNNYLLGFGTLIFAIMLFVGTMNSAADGQFLGRKWDSIWTPIRLVIGLLFLVPLSSGFCVGQYVFLYIILIGVKIATGVWTEVVMDVFKDSTPPAVPTYVTQFVLKVIEEQMILDNITEINAEMSGTKCASGAKSCGFITVNVDSKYKIGGNIPATIIQLVKNKSKYACEALYPGLANFCSSSVVQFVTTAATDGKKYHSATDSNTGVAAEAWFSTQGPGAQGNTPDPSPDKYWTDSDDTFWVHGFYNYHFQTNQTELATSQNGIPPDMQAAYNKLAGVGAGNDNDPDSFNGFLKKEIQKFDNNMVLQPPADPSDPDLNNLCLNKDGTANSNCSLQGLVEAAVNHGFLLIDKYNELYAKGGSGVEGDSPYVRYSSPYYSCKTDPETHVRKCTLNPADESNRNPTGPQNDYASFAIQGMAYTDNNGQIRQNIINVPLLGSWWNAGESYLIMDAQFANNLQLLIDFLKKGEVDFSSNDSVTGAIALEYYSSFMETGYPFNQGDFATTHPLFMNPNCVSYSAYVDTPDEYRKKTTFIVSRCYMDQLRVTSPEQYIIDVASGQWIRDASQAKEGPISLSNLDLGSNWTHDIRPYMPKANEIINQQVIDEQADRDAGKEVTDDANKLQNYLLPNQYYTAHNDDLDRFYQQLLAVPLEFQAPLDFILVDAQTIQDGGDPNAKCGKATKQPCYLVALPYLENIMNVLAANGLLNGNQQDPLPVSQAMNSMFDNLLGGAGTDADGIKGGAVGLNSIMQQVYSLGTFPSSNGIIADQFSLIQQTRNVGIGVLVTCLNAMTMVYSHYTALMTNMIQKVEGIANNTDATDLAKMSGIPIIGPIIGGFAAASEAQQQLQIMTVTTTTMSNIGIQLMWMPLFLFVMTSLFVIGVQFAMLIPFMPYIMFWAGEIAWVLGVLEALIAAPLVMLGIAHPGGHEHLGHGQGAVRMLIGIVFRPVLMVIGMIMGIMLTYVLITFSADGFHIIAASTFNALPTDNVMLSGAISCLLLFTYGSFLVMAFTKCFSPIYMIPEKVVEWIGGSAAKAGEQEAQQFASNVQQTAEKGSQAGGQALQQGIQAQEQKGQKMSDLAAQSNKTSFESTSAISKGIGESSSQLGQIAMKVV